MMTPVVTSPVDVDSTLLVRPDCGKAVPGPPPPAWHRGDDPYVLLQHLVPTVLGDEPVGEVSLQEEIGLDWMRADLME